MTISFVIVTYQSSDVIEDCLRHAQSVPTSEIIVVDNASTDDTVAKILAMGVRVDVLKANLGFASAANIGASIARDDLLCFLNPDCHVNVAVCEAAVLAMRNRTNACAVPDFRTGDCIVAGRQPGYTYLKLIVDMMEASHWPHALVRRLRRRPNHHDTNWHWPLGTCLFVPKETFVALGGFDSSYFMYMEDVELGRALSLAGGEVISLPHILDHGGATGSRVSWKRRRDILAEGRLAYGRRHYGWPFMALMKIIGAV
jgi:N-acetylglucosaminyl-diphospho-decaprenol L-rhamnosyltransferase